MKVLFKFFVIFIFAASWAWPPTLFGQTVSCTSDIDALADSELAAVLAKCEEEIAAEKKNLSLTQAQAQTLQRAITELNQRIRKNELEIKARKINIKQLGEKISDRDLKVRELAAQMDKIRDSLALLLRKTSETNDLSAIEALLSSSAISVFFEDLDQFAAIQVKLGETLEAMREVKRETEEEQKALEADQRGELELKLAQEREKRQTENYRGEKERILEVTRGEERAYKQIIAEKEQIKNEIRNRIFRTVGGQEMTFEQALKLVLPYQNLTGVDAALTLAVLSQESSVDGLIGRNLGKCFYNQPANNISGTVMANSQKLSFLAITGELGLNPETTPVSCPIYSDGSYGGAMGPAQFMPRTWWNVDENSGYKFRVTKLLDEPLPSPFNNLDAFTATAIYLSDAQALCSGSSGFGSTFEIWSCSAAKYYSGLATRASRLARYMRLGSYGHQVATRAMEFRKDIDLLDL